MQESGCAGRDESDATAILYNSKCVSKHMAEYADAVCYSKISYIISSQREMELMIVNVVMLCAKIIVCVSTVAKELNTSYQHYTLEKVQFSDSYLHLYAVVMKTFHPLMLIN